MMLRGTKFQQMLSLGLAWAFMAGMSGSLAAALRGMNSSFFFPVACFGVTLSWIGTALVIRTWKIWLVFLITGFLFVFVINGNLMKPMLDLLIALPGVEFNFLRSYLSDTTTDLSGLNLILSTFATRIETYWHNLGVWLNILLGGGIPDSPAGRRLIWSAIVLLLSLWTGWLLKRHGKVWPALAPFLLLSAYLLFYSRKSTFSFQAELIVLFIFMGTQAGFKRISSSSYSLMNPYDTLKITFNISVLAAILIGLSGWIPSISIGQVSKTIKEYSRTRETDDLAGRLGLQAAAQAKEFSSQGLPREHLIGADPAQLKNVVFTVQVSEYPIGNAMGADLLTEHLYWRSITYNVYTGKGWATSLSEGEKYPANSRFFDKYPPGYLPIQQYITRSPGKSERVYWTGTLWTVDQPFEIAWRNPPLSDAGSVVSLETLDMLGALTRAANYRAISLVPNFSASQLRSARASYPPDILALYLQLPAHLPSRVVQLAEDLTVDKKNSFDKALMIESYLRTFPYTLDVSTPPAGRDAVDYFLFDVQRGYCDYYASAMVVLARAAGLPARLVIGYASGVYDPVGSQYIIRAADAHSWAEIYFAGFGWIEFEPSGNRPPSEHSYRPALDSDMKTISGKNLLRNSLRRERPSAFSRWPLWIPAFVGVIITGLVVRAALALERSSRGIFPIYAQIYRLGRRLTQPANRYETLTGFAEKLHHQLGLNTGSRYPGRLLIPAQHELATLTKLYEQALYGPVPLNGNQARLARRLWMRFYWRLLLARLL